MGSFGGSTQANKGTDTQVWTRKSNQTNDDQDQLDTELEQHKHMVLLV